MCLWSSVRRHEVYPPPDVTPLFSQEMSVVPQLGGLSFKISFLKSIKSLNTKKTYVLTSETTQMEKFPPFL